MAKFTKQRRQQIVAEFAKRHNGNYNPRLFLSEVEKTGAEHPAHDWFEWDDNKAAAAHRVDQARNFARDLRVTFKVEEIGKGRTVSVKQGTGPMVLSPMAGRSDGGGYVLADLSKTDHMAEHRKQAAAALRAWLNRYSAALEASGESADTVRRIAASLDAVDQKSEAA